MTEEYHSLDIEDDEKVVINCGVNSIHNEEKNEVINIDDSEEEAIVEGVSYHFKAMLRALPSTINESRFRESLLNTKFYQKVLIVCKSVQAFVIYLLFFACLITSQEEYYSPSFFVFLVQFVSGVMFTAFMYAPKNHCIRLFCIYVEAIFMMSGIYYILKFYTMDEMYNTFTLGFIVISYVAFFLSSLFAFTCWIRHFISLERKFLFSKFDQTMNEKLKQMDIKIEKK